MVNQPSSSYPATGPIDLIRLVGSVVSTYVRGPASFSFSNVLQRWVKSTSTRLNSENFTINLVITRFFLITGKELSQEILSHPPSPESYMEGPNKVKAMSFLAPQALTICHDEKWQRLRQYNEAALDLGHNPQKQHLVLDRVHQEFSNPISSSSDIRTRMSRIMLGVVFGNKKTPDHLAQDIQVLFGYVASPLRIRMRLLGWRERGRRARFYKALCQLWDEHEDSGEPSLLNTARELANGGGHSRDELLDQIPHWMFTFTGSGTDLISRTFALVASRPAILERIKSEINSAGPLSQVNSIDSFQFLEACLLETGRLYPPVTFTSHVAPEGMVFNGSQVPSGVEIIHYFPINHRDSSADSTADDFLPQRWLDPNGSASADYPNLFLSGPRTCPGKNLILFIAKAALATMLSNDPITIESPLLARDPLPFSFPAADVHIRA